MTKSFGGQVAIVTGAGTGIGFDIVKQLTEQGASVVINELDPELLSQAIQKIGAGDKLIPVSGDASDLSVIDKMVQTAVETFGQLDIVIANAGITSYGSFMKFTAERFEQLVNLNLRGSFFLAQKAAEQMIKQGDGGRILFMSSVTGLLAHPYLAAYGMTKAALKMLASALVIELAPHGITTNAIAPGAVATERTTSMTPDYDKIWGGFIPTGKVSYPTDISRTALFLVSKESGQINGQTIVVDGGITSICAVDEDTDKPEE